MEELYIFNSTYNVELIYRQTYLEQLNQYAKTIGSCVKVLKQSFWKLCYKFFPNVGF